MRRITLDDFTREAADDLAWMQAHDPNTWAAYTAMCADYPPDTPCWVADEGQETTYCVPQADFALATYGQDEPRCATWLFDEP